MSMSSSLFRQKNNDFSGDMEDVREQNRLLYEENLTLKKSLEELISINTELTESIEEFNNSHVEHFPHINQQEIEQLALRVIELEQDLEHEKSERAQEREQGSHNDHNGTVEETLKVIEELVNSFRAMQEEYQQELERMDGQLEGQKNQWLEMSESVEHKMLRFEEEYGKLVKEMRHAEGVIKSLERDLQDNSKNVMLSRK